MIELYLSKNNNHSSEAHLADLRRSTMALSSAWKGHKKGTPLSPNVTKKTCNLLTLNLSLRISR